MPGHRPSHPRRPRVARRPRFPQRNYARPRTGSATRLVPKPPWNQTHFSRFLPASAPHVCNKLMLPACARREPVRVPVHRALPETTE
ncbi:hypothetical protein GCM10010350_32680 [Streptomyces galilaeus]|nr:hypothetical protein GCM10010350_32680 [Streptomyces galilaeus]